jgi:hypothetical protein
VEFVVDAQGQPEKETVHIVRQTSPDLAEALAASVISWKYKPAIVHEQPVRQIVTETYKVASRNVVMPLGVSQSSGAARRTPQC